MVKIYSRKRKSSIMDIMEKLGFEIQNNTKFIEYTFLDEPVED